MFSSKVKEILSFITKFLTKHRGFILWMSLYFIFFFILFFPFGSLKQILTDTLHSSTKGKVAMEFKTFFLNPLSVSLSLKKTRLHVLPYPPVEIDQLILKPSLFSLLRKQLRGQIKAKGLFNGKLDFKMKPSSKSISHFVIKIEKVDLEPLSSFLPFTMNGKLKYLESKLQWNHQIPQESEGQIQLHGQKIQIFDHSIKTAFGDIPIPAMTFQQVQGKLELSERRIHINNFQLIGPDLNLNLQGHIKVILKSNFHIQPQSYRLKTELKVNPQIEKELSFLLGFLEKYKKIIQGKYHYNLQLSSSNIFTPPQISSK